MKYMLAIVLAVLAWATPSHGQTTSGVTASGLSYDAKGMGAPIVTGDQDQPYVRDIAGVIERGVQNGKHVSVKGSGHFVNLDNSTALNTVLTEFLMTVR
jgi:hypothetical protein